MSLSDKKNVRCGFQTPQLSKHSNRDDFFSWEVALTHAEPIKWGCQTQISKDVMCDLFESNKKYIKKLFSKDVKITKIISAG